MAAGHVYHWKHGWIPLTYFAALQKAHGSRSGAISALHAATGVHGSDSPGHYVGGIAITPEAAKTQIALSKQGLHLGSSVYWRHPGTGMQTKAKIVGVEQTGHIIVQHSGNRNALIGHTTYSVTPHENTAFQTPFRHPHSHTTVVEQDEKGNPIGYRPRATGGGSKPTGPTIISRRYDIPKRVDAPPPMTPKATASSPLPNEFKRIDPSQVVGNHNVTTASRRFEAAKIKQAFELGPHKVYIQAALTKDQTQGLLHDIKETLHSAHGNLNGEAVNFLVPTGDGYFRTRKAGVVMGYVIRGGRTVNINPKVATGAYKLAPSSNGQHTPASKGASTRRYVITHELGHIVDNINHRTDQHGMFHEGRALFNEHRGQLGSYAGTSITEGYAEAFAQHQLGGAHHGTAHKIAEKYAATYGWQKAK